MKKTFAIVLGSLFLGACGPSPVQVVTEMEAAYNAKNLDGVVATLADTATLKTGTMTVAGKDKIKAALTGMLAQNTHAELMGEYKAEGETVSWHSKVTNDDYAKLGLSTLEAESVATVHDGKVQSFTWNLTPESTAKITTAQSNMLKKTVDQFHAALNGKNVDAALALVADDAVFTLDKPYIGKEQVKAWLTETVAMNTQVQTGDRTVENGKVVFTTKLTNDEFKKANLGMLDGKGEVVVLNGKLKSLTHTWTAESQKKLAALTATAAAAPVKGAKAPAKAKK